MPTESWKHHSHINPWNGYATYELSFLVSDTQNWFWTLVKIIQIEKTFFVIKIIIMRSFVLKCWKTASMLRNRQIGGVFHRDLKFWRIFLLLRNTFDKFPIFILKLCLSCWTFFFKFVSIFFFKFACVLLKCFDTVCIFYFLKSLKNINLKKNKSMMTDHHLKNYLPFLFWAYESFVFWLWFLYLYIWNKKKVSIKGMM